MSTLHEDLRRLARECQSLVSKYTRAPGVNGDRVADLLIQDTYRIGTAMLEALAAHDAKIADKVLRGAADAVLTEFDPPIEACIWASEWLRDRAARIARAEGER